MADSTLSRFGQGTGIAESCAVVSATSLSICSYQNSGTGIAMVWLVVAVASGLGALCMGACRGNRASSARPAVVFRVAIMICLGTQFVVLLGAPLNPPIRGTHPEISWLLKGVLELSFVLAGVAAIASFAGRPKLERLMFPALVAAALAAGIIVIAGLPAPGFDSLKFQKWSIDALWHGMNPYALRFADPYPPRLSTVFYGEGLSVAGVLQFGYPYMPVSLVMSVPGYLLGDVRYSHLIAILATAVLIARTRRDAIGRSGAILFLFTPILPLMVYGAWTECFVLFLMALTLYCHNARPKLMPYALGLLMASKQYMPLVAPLALLLLPMPWNPAHIWKVAWRAAATACAVTLPLVLWSVPDFLTSAVSMQFRQPFRRDSLSFLAWLRPSSPAQWLWLPFLLLLVGVTLCLWGGRRRPVSFPLAVALCLMLFFSTNKQAFGNYYYFVIGALLCGAVSLDRSSSAWENLGLGSAETDR